MRVLTRDEAGKETGMIELSEREVSPALIKRMYQNTLAMRRNAHAKTKKRGEVSGGGKKPWRQKGTGRARIGSSRAPHWTGGGRVFGPTGRENYAGVFSKGERSKAFSDALYLKAKADVISVVAPFPEFKKTKEAATLVTKLTKGKKVLLVFEGESAKFRPFKNISSLSVKKTASLSVKDIVDADWILLADGAKELLEGLK